jgi:hypothetical protein
MLHEVGLSEKAEEARAAPLNGGQQETRKYPLPVQ